MAQHNEDILQKHIYQHQPVAGPKNKEEGMCCVRREKIPHRQHRVALLSAQITSKGVSETIIYLI